MRGNPIGFRVQRLNHSATVTSKTTLHFALTEGVRISGKAGPKPCTYPDTPPPGSLPLSYAIERKRVGWTGRPREGESPARRRFGISRSAKLFRRRWRGLQRKQLEGRGWVPRVAARGLLALRSEKGAGTRR